MISIVLVAVHFHPPYPLPPHHCLLPTSLPLAALASLGGGAFFSGWALAPLLSAFDLLRTSPKSSAKDIVTKQLTVHIYTHIGTGPVTID